MKVFLCDGQGANRQAILSGDRSCLNFADVNFAVCFFIALRVEITTWLSTNSMSVVGGSAEHVNANSTSIKIFLISANHTDIVVMCHYTRGD